MKLRNIEILEDDPNKKGDLFGRLTKDFFHSIGYDEPRLNISKSGREIDLTAHHRTEKKIAIAECKAHATPIGGADINKFVGVIDAESRKNYGSSESAKYVNGYFISISGFRETAIEQEKQFNNERVILIKPEKLVNELINGKILVDYSDVINLCSPLLKNGSLAGYMDLVAYDKGWIWAVYFSNNEKQSVTHVAFVHAEGKILLKELALEIVNRNEISKALFSNLTLLNNTKAENNRGNLERASSKYFKYLENELGNIHFEGLPTDKEAGSVKVKLENIFVPLHFTLDATESRQGRFSKNKNSRENIGDILTKHNCLALLAKPGGGKSTLIKRIAISYAFPERRKQINDGLPEKDWFPIFLRCRELGEKVTWSITEIINSIPLRAEIQECLEDFKTVISNVLQNGNALLLIDGLDEISEDKNRIVFINQLRTFIATYPNINIVVTSRHAGFRVVAGSLASYCEKYALSNLSESEISELCLKWHKAIIDESASTVREATKLSEVILKDNRIKVLAENPLLLTTLLFVKRWAGYLPTKRSVLYQEMIKLLLVTWNVEGHEILDIEEAEPQLAFVALWMTKNGKQTITAEELNSCLIEARKQMPEILGYTNISPAEFIKRVESRSSLLILTGHQRSDSGTITAIYEFLHLSFQEYLTAKAIVKKYLPREDLDKNVIEIVSANVDNENWKEVIPLVAVLLEREAGTLIQYLIDESRSVSDDVQANDHIRNRLAPFLLASCLSNEVQINPILLSEGIEWFAKNVYNMDDKGFIDIILKNKFGSTLRKRIYECFYSNTDDKYMAELGSTLGNIIVKDLETLNKPFFPEIIRLLDSNKPEDHSSAALALMIYSYDNLKREKTGQELDYFEKIFLKFLQLLKSSKDPLLYFSVSWSITWAKTADVFPEKYTNEFATLLVHNWLLMKFFNQSRMPAWALSKILTPNTILSDFDDKFAFHERLQLIRINSRNEFDKCVSYLVGLITNEAFEESELTNFFSHELPSSASSDEANISSFIDVFQIEIVEEIATDSKPIDFDFNDNISDD